MNEALLCSWQCCRRTRRVLHQSCSQSPATVVSQHSATTPQRQQPRTLISASTSSSSSSSSSDGRISNLIPMSNPKSYIQMHLNPYLESHIPVSSLHHIFAQILKSNLESQISNFEQLVLVEGAKSCLK